MSSPSMGEYVEINSEALEKQMKAMVLCWESYLNGITGQLRQEKSDATLNYKVDVFALKEMIKRVHQRKDYFSRYHSGMKMSEFKEIGLYMFWISKFRPFFIEGSGIKENLQFDVNNDFAIFYMLSALKNMANKKKWKYITENFTDLFYTELHYSMNVRDISKEAMGIVVQAIAYAVIPDLIEEDIRIAEKSV